jgi:hypothetical protein
MGTLFYHSDSLSYWRKRKNLPHQPVALDMASQSALANLIRTYPPYLRDGARTALLNFSGVVNSTTSLPIPRIMPNKALCG